VALSCPPLLRLDPGAVAEEVDEAAQAQAVAEIHARLAHHEVHVQEGVLRCTTTSTTKASSWQAPHSWQ